MDGCPQDSLTLWYQVVTSGRREIGQAVERYIDADELCGLDFPQARFTSKSRCQCGYWMLADLAGLIDSSRAYSVAPSGAESPAFTARGLASVTRWYKNRPGCSCMAIWAESSNQTSFFSGALIFLNQASASVWEME